jgi:hypothetical protein
MSNGSALLIPDNTSFRARAKPTAPLDERGVMIRIDTRERCCKSVVFSALKIRLPPEFPYQASHRASVATTMGGTGPIGFEALLSHLA